MTKEKELKKQRLKKQRSRKQEFKKNEFKKKEFGKRGFRYLRVIRFQETDAAGVVYFANLLSLCHEAFEASLAKSGIDLAAFFSKENGVATPIVHTEADFHRPLRCGDSIEIQVNPVQLKPHSFEIHYQIDYPEADEKTDSSKRPLVTALTTHVCIDVTTQRIQDLSTELLNWIATIGTSIEKDLIEKGLSEKGLASSVPND